MTKEEKSLLLKDLCSRLPYGVLVMVHDDEINEPVELLSINPKRDKPFEIDDGYGENSSTFWNFEDIKPYLRPMSSMTKEEEYEYHQCKNIGYLEICEMEHTEMLKANALCFSRAIEWLNKKGFDYHGLIPIGLALEATKDMYKTE